MWSETFDCTVDGHMHCTVSFHNHIRVLCTLGHLEVCSGLDVVHRLPLKQSCCWALMFSPVFSFFLCVSLSPSLNQQCGKHPSSLKARVTHAHTHTCHTQAHINTRAAKTLEAIYSGRRRGKVHRPWRCVLHHRCEQCCLPDSQTEHANTRTHTPELNIDMQGPRLVSCDVQYRPHSTVRQHTSSKGTHVDLHTCTQHAWKARQLFMHTQRK